MYDHILNALFPAPQNKIVNIYGWKRIIVDLLMAGGLFRKNFLALWKDIFGVKKSNYDAYLSNFKHYKYVYFNGGVFLDCFSPKWPGEAFFRTSGNAIKIFTNRPDNWRDFTIALIISITKKCVYRCEHSHYKCGQINQCSGERHEQRGARLAR